MSLKHIINILTKNKEKLSILCDHIGYTLSLNLILFIRYVVDLIWDYNSLTNEHQILGFVLMSIYV